MFYKDSLLGLASVYKSTVKIPFVVSMTTDMIGVLKTANQDGELLAGVEKCGRRNQKNKTKFQTFVDFKAPNSTSLFYLVS